ncbi:MAG: c-type cytochrome [Gammaproteobacteria bacterium]
MKSLKFIVSLPAVVLPLSLGCGAVADELDTGSLIARCAVCHTKEGLAGIPDWPAIAGMKKEFIVGKLKGHRAGLVNDSTMKKVAHDLTDAQIDAVADHFSKMLPADK